MDMEKMMVFSLTLMLVMGSVAFVAVGFDFSSETELKEEEVIRGNDTRQDPVMIYDVHDLQDMSLDMNGNYVLANHIDASETSTWNGGAGFAPVGTGTNPFTGTLDGNGYEIRDLYINRPGELNVGMFGQVNGATIENLKVTGSVSGNGWVGGLVGYSVSGPLTIQGVVMEVDVANVNTYTIERVGGLVGVLHNGNRIRNCTSHGSVDGPASASIGGLVGRIHLADVIVENSYSTGLVNGGVPGAEVGGLVGSKHVDAQVISSYWDTVTSGQGVSAGGEGKTTAEMMTQSTFAGWDFDIPGMWAMAGYPRLQWEHTTEITTVEELQLMKLDFTADYTLMNDIDASSTSMWNGGAGFEPVAPGPWDEPGNHFSGVFDGNNHTITGLYIDRPDTSSIGLFGHLGTTGSLKYLGMIDNEIVGYTGVGGIVGVNRGTIIYSYSTGHATAYRTVGGIAGRNHHGTIANCYTTGIISGTVGSSWYIGGVLGYNNEGTVHNSHATGAVSGPSYVGGLVGYNRLGIISDSYATASSAAVDRVGGLVGTNLGQISNSYAAGAVTGSNIVGGLVGDNTGTVSNSYYDLQTTGQGDVGKGEPRTTAQMMTRSTFTGWDFQDVWWMIQDQTYPLHRWAPGHGTPEHPYPISDVHDLQDMWDDLNGHYALVNHIDASETSTWNSGAGFVPVGTADSTFTGALYGNGFEIRYLYINRPNAVNVGLFGRVEGATVENLKLTGSVTGNGWVGGLIGYSHSGSLLVEGVVTNVDVENVNVYSWERVGGLVGILHDGNRIRNCVSHGSVDGRAGATIGGLVGRIHSPDVIIENSYSTGLVNGSLPGDNVGGLVGFKHASAQVISSYWNTETSGQTVSDGGEGKTTNQMMTRSTFTGWDFTIPGKWAMAGYPHLQWVHTTEITTVVELQLMKLDLNADYTLLNDIDASSTSMWNDGAGFESVGTSGNPFTGSLYGNGHVIGDLYINRPDELYVGMFGRVDGFATIEMLKVTGSVTGNGWVGGLVGYSATGSVIIESVMMYVDVANVNTHTYDRTGGLVGILHSGNRIRNSASHGSVDGPAGASIGGLVGRIFSADVIIENSYSTGLANGGAPGTDVGGLIGFKHADAQVINSYWDTETSQQAVSAGGEGKTTIEMKTQGTFIGWDFEDIWWMIEGITYPLHIWGTGQGTPEDPYWIFNVYDLQDMDANLNAHYALANDIDASETSTWNDGAGFEPVGTVDHRFTGSLDGKDFTVSHLFIYRNKTDNVGLFGYVDDAEIRNLGLTGVDITGANFTGSLYGRGDGVFSNLYSTGEVSGGHHVGGLIGFFSSISSTLSDSYSTANATGSSYNVGGLVGRGDGSIIRCHATGDVTGTGNIGGLIGTKPQGMIWYSFSTGDVSGRSTVGGFIGILSGGSIYDCYSTGTVTRTLYSQTSLAGFCGRNFQARIFNSYSTGAVYWQDSTQPNDRGFLGTVDTGGNYNMEGNFWDVQTSGQTSTGGNATGLPTAQMKTENTFTEEGWDFDDTWHMVEGFTYPLLHWQPLPEVDQHSVHLTVTEDSDGWNFVSFNLLPDDTSPKAILHNIYGSYDRLMYYDTLTGEWFSHVPGRAAHFNNLQSWDNTMGVWISVTEDVILTVFGSIPESTDITLYPGWNMVGLPSESAGNHGLPTEVTRIGYFDASMEYNVAYNYDVAAFVFEPGRGYWVYNGADTPTIWTVEY